jgi:acyl-CoA thioester hydrolase
MDQEVFRGDTLLFSAQVTIACIGQGGKPTKLPAKLRSMIKGPKG